MNVLQVCRELGLTYSGENSHLVFETEDTPDFVPECANGAFADQIIRWYESVLATKYVVVIAMYDDDDCPMGVARALGAFDSRDEAIAFMRKNNHLCEIGLLDRNRWATWMNEEVWE